MGYFRDWSDDYAYERESADIFNDRLDETEASLSKMSDAELLKIAVEQGKDLNTVTDRFPAYDVALKIKKNDWKPTEKQRKAIIGIVAFYITRKECKED